MTANRGSVTSDGVIGILTVDKYFLKFISVFDSLPQADRDAFIKAIEKIEGYDKDDVEDDDDDTTFVHSCFGGTTVERKSEAANSSWNQIDGDVKPAIIEVIESQPKLVAYICQKQRKETRRTKRK